MTMTSFKHNDKILKKKERMKKRANIQTIEVASASNRKSSLKAASYGRNKDLADDATSDSDESQKDDNIEDL